MQVPDFPLAVHVFAPGVGPGPGVAVSDGTGRVGLSLGVTSAQVKQSGSPIGFDVRLSRTCQYLMSLLFGRKDWDMVSGDLRQE